MGDSFFDENYEDYERAKYMESKWTYKCKDISETDCDYTTKVYFEYDYHLKTKHGITDYEQTDWY